MGRKKHRRKHNEKPGGDNNLEQARKRSCGYYFAMLGRITWAGLSLAILILCAKIQGRPLRFHGVDLTYEICGMALSAASFADFLVLDRFWKVIEKRSRDDLNELQVYPSMLNFLAAFGSRLPARLQSYLALVLLIFSWWLCYVAVSILNPYRWNIGFELMLLGSGMLCLQRMSACKARVDQVTSDFREPRVKLPVVGEVEIEDIVVALAAGIGALMTLTLSALATHVA